MNGSLLKIDGRTALRFERRLTHPPERVWRALTEPGEVGRWFPATPEWDLVPGAKIMFRFREEAPVDDMTQADFEGEVVAVEPLRLLEFTWSGEVLRWELAPDGGGTLLTFTTAFDGLGRASRDAAGWDVCLEVLEAALDGRDVSWDDQMKRWDELFPSYVESFGPEASAEGKPEGI